MPNEAGGSATQGQAWPLGKTGSDWVDSESGSEEEQIIKNLLKRMRAQANCAEYAPLALLLMVMSELMGSPAVALHLMGLTLLAGRVLHALGFAATPQKIVLRQLGMLLTLLMMAVTALGLLAHAVI